MPFTSLSESSQKALLARLARKGLTRRAIQKTEDLVVQPDQKIELSADASSLFKPVVRKPKSFEEAKAWFGHPPIPAEYAALKASRLKETRLIKSLIEKAKLDKIRPPRKKAWLDVVAANPEQMRAFTVATHAAVAGIFDPSRWAILYKEITNLVVSVDVLDWSWVYVVIKAGGVLSFSPPGPHTFIAHSLVVEAGGKIVTNQCYVNFDCEYMEFK
jgi:hypothetical protein